MESIEIEGFLTISKAHFEIKKINILIGTQASGKSIVAKLVYFFKKFFSDIFIKSIENNQNKTNINKHVLEKFEQLFPKYTWDHQEFIITYKYNNYQVSISRKKTGSHYSLKFDYCAELKVLHKSLKTLYKKNLDEYETSKRNNRDRKLQLHHKNFLYHKILENNFGVGFQSNIFIPASRSFFANLQKNVFSFLANNIDLDPLIKEFGSKYERAKRYYFSSLLNDSKKNTILRKKFKNLITSIISGEYVVLEEKDWIAKNGKKTNLANASSGQQESLPMLIILSIWPFVNEYGMCFIEEPEAHLFPTSQKQVISILATIYKECDHSFFITTHSPYILTAINNLVIGSDAYDNCHNDKDRLQLSKLIPQDEIIKFEDVSAYTFNQGKLESIMDEETRLIGSSIIDAVSENFAEAFDLANDIANR